MASSKLRQSPQAASPFTGTPTSILDDIKRLISRSRQAQDQIVQNVKPEAATFTNVLLPLAQAENALNLESNILCFYKDVSLDLNLRDASSEAQKLFKDFELETAMREDLFHLVDTVLNRNENLDTESHHLLQKQHREFIRNGLKLSLGSQRDRFKKIQKRLNELIIEFRKIQNEDNGEKGIGKHEGILKLTFDFPHYLPALKYAKNSETRKKCYIASQKRCELNVPTFKEIMVFRDEAARLLGYSNHAAFRIEEKMAKTPSAVNTFLDDLRSRLIPRGRREVDKLKELKKADLETRRVSFDGRFYLWDSLYYKQMMLEKQYLVNQQSIAEYFPLETTIQGMLRIFENLFGLVFVKTIGDEKSQPVASGNGGNLVWHEDVQVFSVWDDEEEGRGFLGYLYLDIPSGGQIWRCF